MDCLLSSCPVWMPFLTSTQKGSGCGCYSILDRRWLRNQCATVIELGNGMHLEPCQRAHQGEQEDIHSENMLPAGSYSLLYRHGEVLIVGDKDDLKQRMPCRHATDVVL